MLRAMGRAHDNSGGTKGSAVVPLAIEEGVSVSCIDRTHTNDFESRAALQLRMGGTKAGNPKYHHFGFSGI